MRSHSNLVPMRQSKRHFTDWTVNPSFQAIQANNKSRSRSFDYYSTVRAEAQKLLWAQRNQRVSSNTITHFIIVSFFFCFFFKLSLVDFFNLEAFDYSGPWNGKTGLSSPLSKLDDQLANDVFLNIVWNFNRLELEV